jgi:hypothetical protein
MFSQATRALTVQWMLMAADQGMGLFPRSGLTQRSWNEVSYWQREGLVFSPTGFSFAKKRGFLHYRIGAVGFVHTEEFCLPPYVAAQSYFDQDANCLEPVLDGLLQYELAGYQRTGGFLRRRSLLSHLGLTRSWQAAWWIYVVGRLLPQMDDHCFAPQFDFFGV